VRVAEPTQARTVAFATLGCRLNQVDTQQLQTMLEARGFRTVDLDEPADVVVVNTCTVTARAEFSDRQTIRRAARVSPRAKVVVTGCWAQTSPGDVAGMSEVDLVVGNDAGVAAGHPAALDGQRRRRCRLRGGRLPRPLGHQAAGLSGTLISPSAIFCLMSSSLVGRSPSSSLLYWFWA